MYNTGIATNTKEHMNLKIADYEDAQIYERQAKLQKLNRLNDLMESAKNKPTHIILSRWNAPAEYDDQDVLYAQRLGATANRRELADIESRWETESRLEVA